MNVLQAFDGPFASWLGDPADWRPWRTFLKTMAAVPLDDDERPLFEACTGRTVEFNEPVSEAWLVVGRRGRKSAVAAMLGVHAACHVDWSSCLAPGEIGRVVVVAVDKAQARTIKSYAEAILASDPTLAPLVTGSDAESITLATGIRIECVANSFRSIRGTAIVCAILEELAFWRSDESANPDTEMLRAIKPAMLTTKRHGALLIGISSPYAKKGALYDKYKQHFGNDDSRILVWKSPTEVMNPAVDREEIEEAYLDDPEAAAAEYGAEFRTDIQNFLDADLLAKLTRSAPLELPPLPGVRYFGFVDPSGGRGDAMTVGIAHRNEGGRAVLDVVRATKAPFDPANVVADYAKLLKEYRLTECTGDNYSGEWVVAAFKDQGITYKPSPIPKSAIYLEALPLFTRAEVELPDYRPLLHELAQLERRTARGGKDSVDHPPRGHDDMANAACGALLAASQRKKKGFAPVKGGAIGGGARTAPTPTAAGSGHPMGWTSRDYYD